MHLFEFINICTRDYNAALNIKEIGLKLISNTPGIGKINACGDTTIGELDASGSRYVSLITELIS